MKYFISILLLLLIVNINYAFAKESINSRLETYCRELGKDVNEYIVQSCTKEQIKRYNNGEPTIITHTEEELLKYYQKKKRQRIKTDKEIKTELEFRVLADKACIRCREMVKHIYKGKDNGLSKEHYESLVNDAKEPDIINALESMIAFGAIEDAFDNQIPLIESIDKQTKICEDFFKALLGNYSQ